jgi:hypothetical protein
MVCSTQSEKDFATDTLVRLSKHFYISLEVEGLHFSGKKLRIDALIKPKDNSGWKNPNIIFGLEFKKPEVKHNNQVTNSIKQVIDYAHTQWGVFDKNQKFVNRYGYLPILLCPGFRKDDNSINSLLSSYSIGELRPYYSYSDELFIIYHQTHKIWRENRGVCEGKTWSLKPDFGSR